MKKEFEEEVMIMYDNDNYNQNQNEEQYGTSVQVGEVDQSVARVDVQPTRGVYSDIYPEDFYRSNVPKPSTIKEKRSKKPRNGIFRKVAMAMVLGIIFGGFAGVAFHSVDRIDSYLNPQTIPNEVIEQFETVEVVENIRNVSNGILDVTEVVNEVMPSVVAINTGTTVSGSFFGQKYEEVQESSGSGIIIGENEEELLIATNYHVIADATYIHVNFIDEESVEGQVKGSDAIMDLAIVSIPLSQIKMSTLNIISIAELGDSEALEVGEPAIAIGNALGYGQSVTTGVISALNRPLEMQSLANSNETTTNVLIQTDAAINMGNSGGALLNMQGQVIGINSNKIGGSLVEGMGYAIPISQAKPILDELMVKETRVKVPTNEQGFIGINGFQVTGDVSEAYNLPDGLYLKVITEGSAADQAGLVVGDILSKFDGDTIYSMEDLMEKIQYYRAGETVTLTVQKLQRQGYAEEEIQIVLGGKPVQ